MLLSVCHRYYPFNKSPVQNTPDQLASRQTWFYGFRFPIKSDVSTREKIRPEEIVCTPLCVVIQQDIMWPINHSIKRNHDLERSAKRSTAKPPSVVVRWHSDQVREV